MQPDNPQAIVPGIFTPPPIYEEYNDSREENSTSLIETEGYELPPWHYEDVAVVYDLPEEEYQNVHVHDLPYLNTFKT